MNKILLFIAALSFSSLTFADQYVHGHYRHNGTYVHSYHRTNPDGNSYDNYSSRGNVNPYTGEAGHRNPGYDRGEYGSYHSRY